MYQKPESLRKGDKNGYLEVMENRRVMKRLGIKHVRHE